MAKHFHLQDKKLLKIKLNVELNVIKLNIV